MPKLDSAKHEAFAQHLALHDNQSEAYRHAYPKSTARMKPETVAAAASRLAADVNVRLRVQELRQIAAEQANERFKMDAARLLQRLQEMDQLDVADILDSAGNILPVHQWPKAWRTSISGIDLQELMSGDVSTIVRKIKLPDKLKVLEMIGKHVEVQAFQDKVEVSAGKSLKELLAEVRGEHEPES